MEHRGRLFISTKASETLVSIEISDDGPGVSLDQEEEIFSPFFTTKGVGEGTGLGLSICYRIVHDDHKGTIRLQHDGPGKGATFLIELPIREAS